MTDEREWETRKRRIDPRLKTAGWDISTYNARLGLTELQDTAVEEFPTDAGPADYALFVDGEVLGFLEGKRVSLGPQNVLTQAERYSKGHSNSRFTFHDGLRVPFLYSSNGEIIWFNDIRHPLNPSHRVAGFHTPNALRELLDRDQDGALNSLNSIPHHRLLRPYQRDANDEIEKALRQRKRQMLLAMATGTGKTLTMVSEVYRLMKAGVARRVLFLVDRRALAAQAVQAFASFEAEPGLKFDQIYEVYSQRFQRDDFDEEDRFDPTVLPNSYLTDPKPGHVFVYISTIQRMSMNLFGRETVFSGGAEENEDDADKLNIPIHAFDLVIADECHRGYTATDEMVWRKTLDHFDAVRIGLTATPAAHTTAYFTQVVFRYPYERAVSEGYLVDYEPVLIHSNVRMHGIFLEEGARVEQVDTVTGLQQLDALEDERQFESSDVEQTITAPDSNRKILEEVARYAAEHEQQFGRFPKTLIFADNDRPHTSHADQLVEIARDVFGRGDRFVEKITGRVDRPLRRIREFRNRPYPGVAVTVDLLTTGVDIPDLEYIVFLRTVRSRILFEQMMGRGTRKGEHVPDKGFFTVFDCFGGSLLEYFRSATGITLDPPAADGKTIRRIIDEIWQNHDREYNVRRLAKRLRRIEKEMSGEAIGLFAPYVGDEGLGSFAESLPERLHLDFITTMDILRDEDFLNLVENYPRPQRVFLVAPGVEDVVTSERLIRARPGTEYKPEDYLDAFDAFIVEHTADLEAIRALLVNPSGWGTEALAELRNALQQAPEHFTEENLELAFRLTKQKAMVDIISMVKHSAAKELALLNAAERVSLAVERLTAELELSDEQKVWLGYIRASLIENLAVGRDDFDLIPVLADRGGWRRADRVFDGQLAALIERLNRALVEAA